MPQLEIQLLKQKNGLRYVLDVTKNPVTFVAGSYIFEAKKIDNRYLLKKRTEDNWESSGDKIFGIADDLKEVNKRLYKKALEKFNECKKSINLNRTRDFNYTIKLIDKTKNYN